MFYRLLGKLFFYFWLLPILTKAVNLVSKTMLDVTLDKMTECAKKQNNVAAERLIKNNVRPHRR